jgi:hypothetical protein
VDLDSLALTLQFMNQFCIARRWDCNLLETVVGLLSRARTAVPSAKVSDVVSNEVGRSVVNNKYSNGYACMNGEKFSSEPVSETL